MPRKSPFGLLSFKIWSPILESLKGLPRKSAPCLTMKVMEEGSDKILPTVELEVEGVNINEWLRLLLLYVGMSEDMKVALHKAKAKYTIKDRKDISRPGGTACSRSEVRVS